MHNFQITFTNPWLLLLMIPALAVVLIPYFMLSKRYRRNRNRITSVVLHICVCACCVLLLAGMGFTYEIDNDENEILLLVDVTYSTEQEKEAKDNYVSEVISMTDTDVYQLGIVTFGFTQEYAVPLTDELGDAYTQYLNAPMPDTSATDIAAALDYAKDLFSNPDAAKIVLITDGVETDESAESVIRTVSAMGIRVDTVACSPLTTESDVRIVNAEAPDYNIVPEEEFEIALSVVNSYPNAVMARVVVYDNDEMAEPVVGILQPGTQEIRLKHTFASNGLHTLRFEIACDGDEIAENSKYAMYMYLNVYDNILVVESTDGQSQQIVDLLDEYSVTVLNAKQDVLPATIEELCEYDEIIFNNIANKDLPEGFIELVHEYVYDVGGGLFTVGGSEPGDPEKMPAHAYNRNDMVGTLYQQMLPVQAIDYTPPLGLMLVIDVSGSMDAPAGANTTRLKAAQDAAVTILRDETCLTERDYCGVMSLSDSYTVQTTLLPMTRQYEIEAAIRGLEKGESTVFTPSIEHAGMELISMHDRGIIEKMHVIILTDGGASDFENYLASVKHYHSLGVSFTFVAIESDLKFDELNQATQAGGGQEAISASATNLTEKLRTDLNVPEIKEVEYGEFTPTVAPDSPYATVIPQEEMPTLSGFYGTRARSSEYVVLSGEYGVPIYAEWGYGAGTVGSFMCDLSGVWSGQFLQAEAGRQFLVSVVNKIFPTKDIRPKDISVTLKEENYITQMSIFTEEEFAEGESVRVEITNLNAPSAQVQISQPIAAEGFSRASFVAAEPGVYEIVVSRLDAEGAVTGSTTVYKSFSYSAEYTPTEEDAETGALLSSLAETGGGSASLLEEGNTYNTFLGFITRLPRSYDPRLVLAILAIVLFLVDVAVRKFKFKWPHEIVRSIREKRMQKRAEK